ncbi:MAG: PaaI family thioesterase [Alphaproteobacteria bacterium]|nr:PaaI family thioesterase [Alphaproteobacteria bacterium]
MNTPWNADIRQPLAETLGIEVVEATKDKVVGRMLVRPEICTSFDTLHGGAIMAFADTLGATGAFLNLPPGHGTTTMESKTNFIGAAKAGTVVSAESTPVHIGKSTSIWTTRILREDGKLVAVVTQTQMVLAPR